MAFKFFSFIPRVELRGVSASITALNEARTVHLAKMTIGTARLAQDILGRTLHYVPRDTGFLASTGDYGPEGTFTRDDVTYTITFTAPYAVFVHENPHAQHAPPTGAFYLLRAVREVTAEQSGHIPFDVGGTFAVTGTGLTESRTIAEF